MNQEKYIFELLLLQRWEKLVEHINTTESIDLNFKDAQYNYPITYAVLYNKKDIVLFFIEKGARIDIIDNDDKTLLFIAIKYNYIDIIKILIEYNKHIIGQSLYDIRDKIGNTIIHQTIILNNIEALQLLLDNGCNADSIDKNGYTSLHLSIFMRSYEMCEMILDHNADINLRNNNGETALHIACSMQQIKIVELLLKRGINIDIQDSIYEYTALHSAIHLHDREIINALLADDIDININIQDIIGNTVLHYAVIEYNYEATKLIMKKNPNVNLWNIDGKIPLYYVLEIDPLNIHDYLDMLIAKSNLNIQNKDGNTCLSLLCAKDLWRDYSSILNEKKMNAFVTNIHGKRPIDFVDKNSMDYFMDMLINSYIYRLRTHKNDAVWSEEWENMCKKGIFTKNLTESEKVYIGKMMDDENINDTMTDLCRPIIKKKLYKIYNKKTKCSKSYPSKKNSICMFISEGQPVEICTFTGSTMDIFIGLIFLLNKYPDTCSTFTNNFIDNKELCKIYRAMGLNISSQCEFLNFEITWINRKIYFVDNFNSLLQKCYDNKKVKYIIIPIGIELQEGSHSNYILFDKDSNEVERFEPHGYGTPYGFDYYPQELDNILSNVFSALDKNITYIKPIDFLPKIGFQSFDIYEKKTKKIGDPAGFCALWAIWYVDMRLTYRKTNRITLVRKMIKMIRENNISFRNLIRNYASNIIEIRDSILKDSNLNVNDWLNDNYTEQQINQIVQNIIKRIKNK